MDVTEDNPDRNKILNLLAFLIESIFFYIQSLGRHCHHVLRRFVETSEFAEVFDAVGDKLAEYPFLKFIVLAAAIGCAVPVVMFVLFVIASIAITFAGFLFIEGTLLVVGGVCMFICTAMMVLVLSFVSVIVVVLYVLTLKLGNILNKFESPSHITNSLVPAPLTSNKILSLTATDKGE